MRIWPSSGRWSTRSSPLPGPANFEALLRVLDPDVVVTTDGGGEARSRHAPLRGAAAVCPSRGRMASASRRRRGRPSVTGRGRGLVVDGAPGRPRIIASFRLREGRIAAIQFNADPAKTQRIVG